MNNECIQAYYGTLFIKVNDNSPDGKSSAFNFNFAFYNQNEVPEICNVDPNELSNYVPEDDSKQLKISSTTLKVYGELTVKFNRDFRAFIKIDGE